MVPGLNPIEEWIQSELQILVAPGPNLAPVDSRRLGDGWQSLIRLAAMEAVAELGEAGRKTFVLAEEPETYLHPHLRRRLRRSLSRLQSSGYQVAVATHAPELISFRERQHIVRLTMTTEGARAREYSTASASQALRDEEKLNERGNHEIVFANVVVLAEGKDDVCALRMGLEKTGLDCDTDSVSIVDCGGVGNLPDYARVCSQLQIPWIAVHDRDLDESGMPKQPTEVAHSALEAIKTSRDGVLTWNNDLEDAIGLRAMGASGKASPLWIDRNHGSREWQTLKGDATITEYIAVIDAVRRGISQALGSS